MHAVFDIMVSLRGGDKPVIEATLRRDLYHRRQSSKTINVRHTNWYRSPPCRALTFSNCAPMRNDSSASVSRSTLLTSSTAGTGDPPLNTTCGDEVRRVRPAGGAARQPRDSFLFTLLSISAFHWATASRVDCLVTSHTTTAPTAFL